MIDLTVKELNKDLVQQANFNSMGGTRGTQSEREYYAYANKILNWKISDEKKRNLLDKLYDKWSEMLRHEAQHVSVMVAGPARYNAKKLDHGDKILELSHNFCKWFDELERQLKQSSNRVDDVQRLIEMAEFADSRDELRPDNDLMELAVIVPDKFLELFERYQPKYKWRKNSNLYKLYEAAKSGKLVANTRETFFEDGNLTAYRYKDRAFIKFVMRPKRQLIIALKSRGWWWNSYESAWSTYLDKVDEEWVSGISAQYEKYI